MDKFISIQMDEAVIEQIGMLAKNLRTTKKAVLEDAVRYYAMKIEAEYTFDILTHTCGAWTREASAEKTVREIKDAMRKSQNRYEC